MDSELGHLCIKVAKTCHKVTFQLLFFRPVSFEFSVVIVGLKIVSLLLITSVVISCLSVHRVKYFKFKLYSMLRYFFITFSCQQRWQFINITLTVCVPFLHYWKSGVNSIEVSALTSGVNVLREEEKNKATKSFLEQANEYSEDITD